MVIETKNTQGEAVITPAVETKPTVETPKTMEQIAETVVPEAKETIGLDKFLELKKDNKELRKSLRDLESKITEGATKQEVSTDIEEISKEFPDVNKQFLNKLSSTIRAQAEKDADAKMEAKLKPLEQQEKAKKIDDAFTTHFSLAMGQMPEFKDIVNPAVIKTLSLNPANANKTFSQIIEETYGNALTGKRTIESTIPGGGKEAETLDFNKARKDTAYWETVMANPTLKAEYNARMLKEGF